MDAANPAAWSTVAFEQFFVGAYDTAFTGILLLGAFDPTNEFISGKWRYIFP